MYFGRVLIFLGLGLLVTGVIVYGLARLGVNLGRLPGDIRLQGESVTCLIPLASSILISIVLTVLLNIVIRFLNR